jgi:hypothetical protein
MIIAEIMCHLEVANTDRISTTKYPHHPTLKWDPQQDQTKQIPKWSPSVFVEISISNVIFSMIQLPFQTVGDTICELRLSTISVALHKLE